MADIVLNKVKELSQKIEALPSNSSYHFEDECPYCHKKMDVYWRYNWGEKELARAFCKSCNFRIVV